MKYAVLIQTRTTQNENNVFLIKNSVVIRCFKDYWLENKSLIRFGTAIVCNNILKIKNIRVSNL